MSNVVKKDISKECSLENSRGSIGGWSQYQIHYQGKCIGFLESGYPMSFDKGFSFECEERITLDGVKEIHLKIYKDQENENNL